MTSYLSGPSLGAATNTRLDSAAKHIQQCRVSQDHMTELVSFDGQCDGDELIRNKYRYCVHKDELVVGIGKSWMSSKRPNSAYPRVLSNLGRLADTDQKNEHNEAIKMLIYVYHNAVNIKTRNKMIETFRYGDAKRMNEVFKKTDTPYFEPDPAQSALYECRKFTQYLHDFVSVGYANTLGWAHAHNGDTMTSVHIGGLRTVQNGHFEVFCGDMIQWYWPFERLCFDETGYRRPLTIEDAPQDQRNLVFLNQSPYAAAPSWENKEDAQLREKHFERQYGQKKGVQKHVPMIKPYKRDDDYPRIYDWYRVFAQAICSARPFEAVDIRISRQAL